ncbi:MAG TPA: helix-hairpin-helix domain-containing protein [Candidatus Dormibacteraeota bacterium]|nr:helix-hairpin-helix domain-containing protein [Candidatus Dormibacteraeota bacterium]
MIDIVKRNWLPIVIAISIMIFIFMMNQDLFGVKNNELIPVEPVLNVPDDEEIVQQEQTSIVVDIKGEVIEPGIYELAIDSRVNDVIELAGGFSSEADQTYVNLAQKVHDEMLIIVPKQGEIAATQEVIASSSSDKVRMNYATQEEVETLSGIGPSKAQAIIQYREEHGLFKSVEDLLNISGIGEKTLEKIKDDIQIP